ncbi:MAG: nuclear transport factor 2 family protein [Acidobacteriia bacterium]|nr:nuclear transport factor 2 family protein [Terriglobia bacterium]
MTRFASALLVSGIVCATFLAAPSSRPAQAAPSEQALLQADQSLLQSLDKADKPALDRLLDPQFSWIDSEGKSLTRAEVLQNPSKPTNGDVAPQQRTYGTSAVVRANRGKLQVLRIWAQRAAGWQAVLYQEVTLSGSGPTQSPAPAARPSPSPCDNPCKTIPFQPETQNEREAIVSWQSVMAAMASNDSAAYSPLIAEEFTATDTHHDVPYTKSDRLAQIQKQKQSGETSAPPALLSARMFDFGESVLMIAREQRPGAKPYFNSRMWVRRDARWQMLFSFNTRIQ